MKTSYSIKEKIKRRGPNSLWTITDFSDLPITAVAKTLSRLTATGFLVRAKKGIYFYPEKTILGPSVPSAMDLVLKSLHKSHGNIAFPAGVSSFHSLGLTTQVPARYTLVSNSATKNISVGNIKVHIVRRNLSHLKNAKVEERWVLDGLRNIKHAPDLDSAEAFLKIVEYVKTHKLKMARLVRFALHEPPRVRALVGTLVTKSKGEKVFIEKLKKSLNPTTVYKLGISEKIPEAKKWNIT